MKEQLLELLPHVFISEAVGSSESGFNGLRLLEKGSVASNSGLINVNIGHARPNLPLPLGIRAAIDADALSVELLEAAVS